MGYKCFGAILIIAGCTGCGFSIAAGKRAEEQLLCQLQQILQFMESELQYRLTPLPELCRMAAGESEGILRTVFRNLHRELTNQKLPDAGSCMSAAIQKTEELPASIRRLLVQLGQTLGRFDLHGQLQGIHGVQQRCEKMLKNIQEKRDERLRCYHTLGICAGVALAILLV